MCAVVVSISKHYKSVFKYKWIPSWASHLCPSASDTANYWSISVSTHNNKLLIKSARHDKTDKTQKSHQNRKFMETGIFIKVNFKSRKQKTYGFSYNQVEPSCLEQIIHLSWLEKILNTRYIIYHKIEF